MASILELIRDILASLVAAEFIAFGYFSLQNYQAYKLERMHLEQDLTLKSESNETAPDKTEDDEWIPSSE